MLTNLTHENLLLLIGDVDEIINARHEPRTSLDRLRSVVEQVTKLETSKGRVRKVRAQDYFEEHKKDQHTKSF